jgi:glycosyltransferase involved in cell wall biosynthesis
VTSQPKVTVLICVHNDAETLPAALDSALGQTLSADAVVILVVDDGSTDGTPEILQEYTTRDSRVAVERRNENLGLVPACNLGLELISTAWFVRLDGDDRFEPELLERLLAEAQTGSEMVTCDRFDEAPDGTREVRRCSGPGDVGSLIAIGTLFSTPRVRQVGGYRDLFWEEYDLYLRLLEAGSSWSHVAEPLVVYTVGGSGRLTSDASALEAGWKELRGLWPDGVLSAHGITRERMTSYAW